MSQIGRVESIKSYLLGYDGKGADPFLECYGIDPTDFDDLPLEKKEELVVDFVRVFRNCIANDLVGLELTDETKFFKMNEQVIEWFIDTGKALEVLLDLCEHFKIDPNSDENRRPTE